MTNKLMTLVLAALLVLPALALAQPAAGQEEAAASVAGRFVQDVDGDGQVSDADIGASLPIYLQDVSASEDTVPPGLIADADGHFNFQFTDAPSADYRLWTGWTPGFIEPEARIDASLEIDQPTDEILQVTLPSERIAAGDFHDLVFLVNPADPEGPIPFPVSTGVESLPVGTATVTVQGAEAADTAQDEGAADTALPDTGTGSSGSALSWPVVALTALAVAGVLGVAVAFSRRKGGLSAH